jgi:hypothetical protein
VYSSEILALLILFAFMNPVAAASYRWQAAAKTHSG